MLIVSLLEQQTISFFFLSLHLVQARGGSDQLTHAETDWSRDEKKGKNLEITDNLKLLDPTEPGADGASCWKGFCEKWLLSSSGSCISDTNQIYLAFSFYAWHNKVNNVWLFKILLSWYATHSKIQISFVFFNMYCIRSWCSHRDISR